MKLLALFFPFFIHAHSLIILVDAAGLDYTNSMSFLRTMVKHPRDWSKNGDVGHAWICLIGNEWVLEGGHTGEFGIRQPKYIDEIFRRSVMGEENPISYLFSSLYDGQFQRGSGGHRPTFAAKVEITEEQFEAMRDFIRRYDFEEYSLVKRQCVHFVQQIAALAGLSLEAKVTMEIEPEIKLGNRQYHLWSDPAFGKLVLASPDKLEVSLKRLVKEGCAEDVTPRYKGTWKWDLSKLKKLKLLHVGRPCNWRGY